MGEEPVLTVLLLQVTNARPAEPPKESGFSQLTRAQHNLSEAIPSYLLPADQPVELGGSISGLRSSYLLRSRGQRAHESKEP